MSDGTENEGAVTAESLFDPDALATMVFKATMVFSMLFILTAVVLPLT